MTIFLAWRGHMPHIVRTVIMMDNITYFWSSICVFLWFAIILFMLLGMDAPLNYNVSHFMLFLLAINMAQHTMMSQYKSMGEREELSIWRSQQSYLITAPLYVLSILQGSAAAWGIAWRKLDKSYQKTYFEGEVIRSTTVWVTFIWVAFFACIAFDLTMYVRWKLWSLAEVSWHCQLGAMLLLLLLAVTLWEPFLALWGLDKSLQTMSKDEGSTCRRWLAGFILRA